MKAAFCSLMMSAVLIGAAFGATKDNPLEKFAGKYKGTAVINFFGSVATGAGNAKLNTKQASSKAVLTLSTIVIDPVYNDSTPLDIVLRFDGKGKVSASAATYSGYTASGSGKYTIKKSKITFDATLVLSDGSVTAVVGGTLRFTKKGISLDGLATFDPGPGPQSWQVTFKGKKKS